MRVDIHQHMWTGPLLDRLAAREAGQRDQGTVFGEPLWWRALTDYVAQMQAAWLTFASFGRREHPELVVVFAMLAGLAPLLSERLVACGGPAVDLRGPRIFCETSSYGPAAVEAIASRVGEAQLVYGSDRPVVEPIATGHEPLLQSNGAGLVAQIATKTPTRQTSTDSRGEPCPQPTSYSRTTMHTQPRSTTDTCHCHPQGRSLWSRAWTRASTSMALSA